ncbi:MAG: N-acetyltransferase [Planctomycetota bacterium]|nr:MAG: N-acetyltransferase [Planctomycetota bacterium]
MEYCIRDYRPEDWTAICRVHDRSRPNELRGSYDPKAFIPLAEDPFSEYISACDMFVAEREKEVVGFAGIDEPYFAWLYVDPAYYRQGIGRALLRHGLDRLSKDAWTLACGNNEAALNLYRSEGFSIESRFIGRNAGYQGASARLALHVDRKGWEKKKRSQIRSREAADGPPAIAVRFGFHIIAMA